jgi:hypothetical protein
MKINKICLTLSLIFTYSYACAGAREQNFVGGQKILFSTKGHGKAKGINLNIFYPSDWTAMEGDRPNIVKKFRDNSQNGVYALIIIKQLPVALSKEEDADFLKDKNLRAYFPTGIKIITTENTQLDGYNTAKVVYTENRSQAGKNFNLNVLTFMTLIERKILITFYFGTSGSDEKEAATKMEKTKDLFFLIANSVVFPDKWK